MTPLAILGTSPIVLLVFAFLGLCLLTNGLLVAHVVLTLVGEWRQEKRDRIAAELLAEFARDDIWRGFDEARAHYEAQQKSLAERQVR